MSEFFFQNANLKNLKPSDDSMKAASGAAGPVAGPSQKVSASGGFFFDMPVEEKKKILAKKAAEEKKAREETEAESPDASVKVNPSTGATDYSKANATLDTMLGPFIVSLMHRDDINEIYINDDGFVRYDSHSEGKVKSDVWVSPGDAKAIIELVAGQRGKVVNEDIPSLSAEISGYGARFQGELPPIVRNPQFNIRKKATKIFTLDDYVKQGVLSAYHEKYIKNAILHRKNILVVGGTGTGKTTFLNAILDGIAKITPYHRIISLEDLPELQCSADDYSPMFTKQETGKDGIRYNMTRLLADCMRRSPDRIIVGEVRDGAAYTMLKAWNTGHEGGACTVHSNTAESGLTRIKSLAQEDPDASGDLKDLIGEAIDIVISIVYTDLGGGKKGRIIKDIIEVEKYDDLNSRYILHHIPRDGPKASA